MHNKGSEMTVTTATERCTWRVIFGTGPDDRQKYIDYGDGSFISTDAETRARRFYAYLSEHGAQACLTRNGAWVAGNELFIEQPAPEVEPVVHKTRTYLEDVDVHRAGVTDRPNYWGEIPVERSTIAHAICTCGWTKKNCDDRTSARTAARYHRKEMAAMEDIDGV